VTTTWSDDGIATVQLNRPDKLNALDLPMFQAIEAAARDLHSNPKLRAVILSGNGKAFSAGLDVKSVSSNPANAVTLLKREDGEEGNLAQNVAHLWRKLPVPVICVTHGVCFGGGLAVALGADIRITTSSCRFSVMEVKWGIIPDMSHSIAFRQLVPIDIAKELTMTGREFDGVEAKSLNLVTHVVDSLEEAHSMAKQLAESIATRSPDAIAATKVLIESTWDLPVADALKEETRIQLRVMGRPNQLLAAARSLKLTKRGFFPRSQRWTPRDVPRETRKSRRFRWDGQLDQVLTRQAKTM